MGPEEGVSPSRGSLELTKCRVECRPGAQSKREGGQAWGLADLDLTLLLLLLLALSGSLGLMAVTAGQM